MKVIDRFPDPKMKAEALQRLTELQQSGDLAIIAAQTEINKIEATNPNLFVSGWRPALGWICVMGFGFVVFSPVMSWVAALAGNPIVVPKIETGDLMTLLIGMLGLGGMRTVEKLQGVHSK
jgi:hypothetical protein